ncbi:hypothetical protein C0966_16935 (plasmid) [Bacillus methanolicus]|uniref:DNA topoisomerase n=1 Tax=Bacillus methanolicus TaxID=1471 RepID=UPI002A434379|nr:hypothetical protein [Bacillus methanolicus]
MSFVINAADAGREGQLLIDEILYFLNNKKPVKRLWTSSLTKNSVIKAFQNLKDNREFKGYYYEAISRQRADWLVGISVTRTLSILLSEKGINKTFSAGRVQSALMGIIYQREKEIENFVSKPYWDCEAEFQFGENKLVGKWFKEDADHIFELEAAQALADFCKDNSAQVYSVIKEEKRSPPPQFYNLSALQMEANRLYGMSPAAVLSYAQSLYDRSLITYPRSDSRYITPEEAKWLPSILNNLAKLDEYKPLINGTTKDISKDKRYVDKDRVTEHFAIVLTEEIVNPLTLPRGEQLIYDLIAKSIIAAHYLHIAT